MENPKQPKQPGLTKEQIKALREALKCTQEEMATIFGVDVRMWQKWEYGVRNPSRATVAFMRYLAKEKGVGL